MIGVMKLNKIVLLFLVLILLSFFAWKIELFWPGGDSGYYYFYTDIILNYLNTGEFVTQLDYTKYIAKENVDYMLNQENIFNFNSSYHINETLSYVFISAVFNYIFNSSYGIIFFQVFFIFFTILEMKKILTFYSYEIKINFWTLMLFIPVILISLVPMKEAFTIFFSTLLFRLFLYQNMKLFFVVFIIFYLYRWNMALLFLGFISYFYISNKIIHSKFKKLYKIFVFLTIIFTLYIGIKYIAYFDSGYNSWEPKMLISAFAFPLIKFGHYEGWYESYLLFGLWNNIYSLSWYFFLPAFFYALFQKNNLRPLAYSLLIIFIIYGSISSGNQIDRIKLEFYPLYISLGLLTFQQIQNKKQYFYFFLMLLFFNFLQSSNYSFGKADSSLLEFIMIPKYLISNLL